MEEEKKLYPLKTVPIENDSATESVQLADLGFLDTEFRNGWLAADTISEVMDMYMDRVVGDEVFEYYGRQFPVMVSFRDVKERTGLAVHPDDVIAEERYDLLGKTKMWYVCAADPGASLFLGFKEDVAAADFYMACRHGDVEGMLNQVSVKAGDCFLIPPGIVHAAQGPVKIAEVAECSPMDFKIYNWGRPAGDEDADEELNLDAAFDFIEYKKFIVSADEELSADRMVRKLVRRPEFSASEVRLDAPVHMNGEQFGGFLVYTCIKGGARIQVRTDEGEVCEDVVLNPSETVLVPAEVPDFYLVPATEGAILIEVAAGKRDKEDLFAAADDEADTSDVQDEYYS